MSLSSAMFTGYTGIKANQTTVDTVGDNLANVNTTAFKSQRTLFETLLYITTHEGTAPSGASGGTLPRQVGTGVGVAAIQRNFSQGGFNPTGLPSDLAVNGNGFFILRNSAGEQVYTRDGAFHLDAAQTLTAVGGERVQGFPVDANGEIDTSRLSEIVIPLGAASVARATENVVMNGNLSATVSPSTVGSVHVSDPLFTTAGGPATAGTQLTDLVNAENAAIFAVGDTVRVQAGKGKLNGPDSAALALPDAGFVVGTDGNTLGDLAAFLQNALALDAQTNGAGVTIGDGVNAPAGALVVASNPGLVSALDLGPGALQIIGAETTETPLAFSQVTAASGEGVTTSFQVFDSLGNAVDVRVRAWMESQSAGSSTWRYQAESFAAEESSVVGGGNIVFDGNGQFVTATGNELTIGRGGVGAAPLRFSMDFSDLRGLAGPPGSSQLLMASQDGTPPGTLVGYQIGPDGVITGTYTNQYTEVLGQVALATFTNAEGLVATSGNQFLQGPNSGEAQIVAPQSAAAGAIVSGALEESNVELVREFVDLLAASTGISAASRVVRTADELLQQLMLLAR